MLGHKDDVENVEQIEEREWRESLDYVLHAGGKQRASQLLQHVADHGMRRGMPSPFVGATPYVNTIPVSSQTDYPGDLAIEQQIENYCRWNAMAMVVRANKNEDGIGGHISTYASAATLYEVGFQHFFRGKDHPSGGDQIYFQGHASPGIYARAFLEGRLEELQLKNFRRELSPEGGLSSYPHPWLMPNFWEFPTVSMGLAPIMAIYQARFNRYLEARGLKPKSDSHVWAYLGDGETDEPETLGAISIAAREKLDNLIFVINCNLQRLDGPVRGNGKIIQDLEGIFRGAGWNVIKVVWGSEWDNLFEKDTDGHLEMRLRQMVDGEFQSLSLASGKDIRSTIFNSPELQHLAASLSDEQLAGLRRGGHDRLKVLSAYQQATTHQDRPTVILAKTVKGFGMGDSGEGKNITHQQKKLDLDGVRNFRDRFDIPVKDKDLEEIPFIKLKKNSPEHQYLMDQRKQLGGSVPRRSSAASALTKPNSELFNEFAAGSNDRAVSTTMAFVRVLAKLLRDKELGKLIVPIIPDEARTFGMEAMFRQFGIYSAVGQLYKPVDAGSLLFYKEAKDGQILEEGITEAGSVSSFVAAGTAYSQHGVNTIPFFIYYSMFGFQRIGDSIWAAGDMRCKGFLVGGTAGRTTLSGEGLQHQDGHSHLNAMAFPNLLAYDPAFAYETAVIVEEGIRRMYVEQEDVFYYITVENENYVMPPMPEGCQEGILKGMYCFSPSTKSDGDAVAHLFGSGSILNEAIKARDFLEESYGVQTHVWSITSFKELYRDATETARWNMFHPEAEQKTSYIENCLQDKEGAFVIASDYMKMLPHAVSDWFPRKPVVLGTDGFGRSDGRRALRDFFEVDARYIVVATLTALAQKGDVKPALVQKAINDMGLDPNKPDPRTV